MRMHVKWGLLLLAGGGFLIAAAGEVQANPTSGANCAGCHDEADRPGAMELTNYDGMLSVDGVNGGTALKYFEVARGSSVPLSLNVLNGADVYGVALNGLTDLGVINGTALDYVADDSGSWTARNRNGFYYYAGAFDWNSETPFTFNLTVSDTSPLDTYELGFQVAGLESNMWSGGERFYLRVVEAVPEPASWVLFSGLGLGLVWYGRRRKR